MGSNGKKYKAMITRGKQHPAVDRNNLWVGNGKIKASTAS